MSQGRSELLRVKKKLENDINELEIGLDHSNKQLSDQQKSLRRALDTQKELQAQVLSFRFSPFAFPC